MDDQPIAWMRRWFFDREKSHKVSDPDTGKMREPLKFSIQPVTAEKMFSDDVPLYAKEPRP